MRLADLKPEIVHRDEIYYLEFDCPKCQTHRIELPVDGVKAPRVWQLSAKIPFESAMRTPTWDEMSVTPSILHETHDADFFKDDTHTPRACKSHFFITEGQIVWA